MHEISIEMVARRFDRASLRRGNSVLPACAPQASTARDKDGFLFRLTVGLRKFDGESRTSITPYLRPTN